MRRSTMTAIALLALVSCSHGVERTQGPLGGENPLAPASEDEIAAAVAAFDPGVDPSDAERSALDAVSAERRADLDATRAELARLLPSPDAFGSFRLGSLQVEDPNGDGRIGDHWYPPRVLRQECSAKVDAAPHPFAVANYLPGSGELGDEDPMAAFDLMSSPIMVSVMVEPFDDAAQLDDYLAATLAYHHDPSYNCGGAVISFQTFHESTLVSERAETAVFEAEPAVLGDGVFSFTVVDDRLLLVVGVSSDAVEDRWDADDLDRWLRPVLDVVLDRLEAAERS